MPLPRNNALPAATTRDGKRQIAVTLEDVDARKLERIRQARKLRSWAEVVRLAIRCLPEK